MKRRTCQQGAEPRGTFGGRSGWWHTASGSSWNPALGAAFRLLTPCVFLLVSACNTPATDIPSTAAAPDEGADAAVSAQVALSAFQQACIGSAPSFADFDARARAAGMSERLRNGGLGTDGAAIGAVIRTSDDGSRRCYVTFQTAEADGGVRSAFAAIYPGARRVTRAMTAKTSAGEVTMSGPVSMGNNARSYELRLDPL